MYLSAADFMAMFIAGSAMTLLMILLFIANYQLLNKNGQLKSIIQNKNKYCALNHTEVPF